MFFEVNRVILNSMMQFNKETKKGLTQKTTIIFGNSYKLAVKN